VLTSDLVPPEKRAATTAEVGDAVLAALRET